MPQPGQASRYITEALAGQAAGPMLPSAVCELSGGRVIGTTRYHDIIPEVDRVEIGESRPLSTRALQTRRAILAL